MENKSLILGLWKFENRVSHEDLLDLADEWAKDDNYVELYIRGVSKDQTGIGFAYKSNGTKEFQDEYFYKTSDQLKRKYGNDLAGWDMATAYNLVKGF